MNLINGRSLYIITIAAYSALNSIFLYINKQLHL